MERRMDIFNTFMEIESMTYDEFCKQAASLMTELVIDKRLGWRVSVCMDARQCTLSVMKNHSDYRAFSVSEDNGAPILKEWESVLEYLGES